METIYEEVPVGLLQWRCDPESLGFTTTNEISSSESIIGQDRALEAIHLGLEMDTIGYNVFVAGPSGTGRRTAIIHLLEKIEKGGKIPEGKCHVSNFKDTDVPHLVSLPPGKGKAFKRDMEELISSLKRTIPLIFESDDYQRKGRALHENSKEKEQGIINRYGEKAFQGEFFHGSGSDGPLCKA